MVDPSKLRDVLGQETISFENDYLRGVPSARSSGITCQFSTAPRVCHPHSSSRCPDNRVIARHPSQELIIPIPRHGSTFRCVFWIPRLNKEEILTKNALPIAPFNTVLNPTNSELLLFACALTNTGAGGSGPLSISRSLRGEPFGRNNSRDEIQTKHFKEGPRNEGKNHTGLFSLARYIKVWELHSLEKGVRDRI